MKIKRIKFQNYTVFEDQQMEFSPGINVIIGENGTGKTHLMKALYAADVAVAISELIENESAYGEIFHITTTESLSWEDAFEKYTWTVSERCHGRQVSGTSVLIKEEPKDKCRGE